MAETTHAPNLPRLILVTNRRAAQRPLPKLATSALAGGIDRVQIREKDLSPEALRTEIMSILELGVAPSRLMINGYPDLANECGTGLHLPESSDMPRPPRRRGALLSRSVHSPAAAAAAGDADFLIAGHVFSTCSKPGLAPLGLEGLSAIVAAAACPVVAIGGVTPDRVALCLRAGASGVAVMSAINDQPDPERAAKLFRAALEQCL